MLKKWLWILVFVLILTGIVSAQTLTWTSTSSLPIPIRGEAVIHYNGYVYCIGGRPTGEGAGTHAIDNVYYAAVNPDGSIGAWTATTALPGKRACHGAYGYNNRIYVWGGWMEDYTTMNTCFYAPINPDGSIGTWVTSSVTIPNSSSPASQMDSFGRGVLAFNDTLYILGGEDNYGTLQSSCYYSKIQGSGDYGAWTATTALPISSWFHGAMTFQGMTANYIYVVGGNYGATTESNIIINTINVDGSLGASWTLATNILGTGTWELGCAFGIESIFAIGGLNLGTPIDNVQRCVINPATGDIIAVNANTPIPGARARTAAVGYTAGAPSTSYILVVGGGGYSSSDPLYTDCWYASVQTDIPMWTLY